MDRSIREFIVQFESYLLVEKKVKTNTYYAYKRDLSQWSLYMQEQAVLFIDQVEQKHIDSFVLILKNQQHATTTVQRKLSVFKMFWQFCAKKTTLVLATLSIPRICSELPFCCTQDQIDAIIEKTNSGTLARHHTRAIVFTLLLHTTSLTSQQISRLRTNTVDKKRKALYINNQFIELTPIVWRVFYEYYQSISPQAIRKNTYLFVVAGKPIAPHALINNVKKLLQKSVRDRVDPKELFSKNEKKLHSQDILGAYAKHPRS